MDEAGVSWVFITCNKSLCTDRKEQNFTVGSLPRSLSLLVQLALFFEGLQPTLS